MSNPTANPDGPTLQFRLSSLFLFFMLLSVVIAITARNLADVRAAIPSTLSAVFSTLRFYRTVWLVTGAVLVVCQFETQDRGYRRILRAFAFVAFLAFVINVLMEFGAL